MNDALPVEQAIEDMNELLVRCDSGNRAGAMANGFMTERRPEVVWPVFLRWWNHCDATWPLRDPIRMILNSQVNEAPKDRIHPAEPWMSPEDLDFYRSLPDEVTLYRGCSRKHVKSLSWSTDREKAEIFARGHRGIKVPDPVVAETIFPKDKIFAVFTGRNESEVVIDFGALGKIKRHKFVPPSQPPKKDGPSALEKALGAGKLESSGTFDFKTGKIKFDE